jgi:class 3 adenylate cyclase
VAYTLNNIGKVYAQQGEYEQAVKYQKEAIERAKSLDAKLEMTQAYLGLAKTYNAQGNIPLSIAAYREAQKTGEEIRIKNELKEIYEGLANVYAKTKDYTDAYKYQALYIVMRDSLYNEEMDKKLQSMTLSYDLEKKQGDIDLLTKDNALQELSLQRQRIATYAAGSTGFLLLVMAIGLFNRYKYVRKTKKIIEDEKERSEKLLLNILPHETANELKEKGTATPKHYDKVSVLFTDFKGFTKIAEKLTAQELIEELNYCFFEFDKIIDKHNLEKIKTIGDAYMCAGGIPAANDTNPVDIVRAGLEIKAFMEQLKIDREAQGKDYWELRIGIHTGQVVAGVVGKNKFAYDIWGDAVNTASRMESSGIPGQVNISGTTYEFIKENFNCTHRGKIQAKNKGEIDMYIVESEF